MTNEFSIIETEIKEGKYLIEASAGTGKTYTISGIYLRLICEKGLKPSDILVVTFTEAAASEIKNRLWKLQREAVRIVKSPNKKHSQESVVNKIIENSRNYRTYEEIKKSLLYASENFDESAIFTIHGFCHRMLTDNAFESGMLFDTELLTNTKEMVSECVEDFFRKTFYHSPKAYRLLVANNIDLNNLNLIATTICNKPDIILTTPKPKWNSLDELIEDIDTNIDRLLQYCIANGTRLNELIKTAPLKKDAYELLTSSFDLIQNSLDDPILLYDHLVNIANINNDFLLAQRKMNTNVGKNWSPDTTLTAFADLCSPFKNYLSDSALQIKLMLIEYFKNGAFKDKKIRLNLRSYNDMLTDLRNALKSRCKDNAENPLLNKIRSEYKAALIDEFQDTDPIQYEIFTDLFDYDESIFYMIGDPKQSIYSFRGADIFSYLNAAGLKGLQRYTLNTNYRSAKKLVEAVDHYFSEDSAPNSFIYDEIPYQGVLAADKNMNKTLIIEPETDSKHLNLTVFQTQNKTTATEHAVELASEKIALLLNQSLKNEAYFLDDNKSKRSVKPGDIAVLTVSRKDAFSMREALMLRNIPNIIQSTGNVFDTSEALDLLKVLVGINNYQLTVKLNSALTSTLIGLSPITLQNIVSDKNTTHYQYWINLFAELKQTWEQSGFISMFRNLLKPDVKSEDSVNHSVRKQSIKTILLSYSEGRRMLTNILHIAELLHKISIERSLGIDGLIKWFTDRIINEEELEEHELRLDSDKDAVQIITIHSSKGLEFPIVFCPFSWRLGVRNKQYSDEFTFHKELKENYCISKTDPDYNTHLRQMKKEDLAERIRLLYVAMTRAVYKLYCFHADIMGRSPATNTVHYYLMSSIINKKNSGDRFTDDDINQFINSPSGSAIAAEMNLGTLRIIESEHWKIEDLDLDDHVTVMNDNMNTDAVKINNALELKHSDRFIRDFGIMSYSSLADTSHTKSCETDFSGGKDEENFSEPEDIITEEIVEHSPDSFFNFPKKGKYTGSFCHEILEQFDFESVEQNCLNIDFKDNAEILLKKYNLIDISSNQTIDNSLYQERVNTLCLQTQDMLNRVLTTPLPEVQNDFRLCSLNNENKISELDFFYPVENSLNPYDFSSLLNKFGFRELKNNSADIKQMLDATDISFDSSSIIRRGFVTGSIDLVFEHNDKYNIADWKGSFLGDSYSDYSRESIVENMCNSGYIIQHNLYGIALHKLLMNRMPGYKENSEEMFEKHFGGIFYFYIRGMNGENNDTGYIFDKPCFEYIDNLFKLTEK